MFEVRNKHFKDGWGGLKVVEKLVAHLWLIF
jgi:hypothetical protein